MDGPEVTVLMSVYNAEAYLAQALASIQRQTFVNYELVVVDDGSTDGTIDILSSYPDERLKVIRNTRNLGLTKSLNRGLNVAKSAFICRVDADDINNLDRIRLQLAYLKENPEIDVVGSWVNIIDSCGCVLGTRCLPVEDYSLKCWALFDSPFIHSSVMFRRRISNIDVRYDSSFGVSQDYALWCSLFGSKWANIPVSLVDHRIHQSSISATRNSSQAIASGAIARQVFIEFAVRFEADQRDRLRSIHHAYFNGENVGIKQGLAGFSFLSRLCSPIKNLDDVRLLRGHFCKVMVRLGFRRNLFVGSILGLGLIGYGMYAFRNVLPIFLARKLNVWNRWLRRE